MNENSSLSSNFWANLRQILALPKGAKVFLIALTTLAAVGLVAAFSLKIWANDKIETAALVFNEVDKYSQKDTAQGEVAYKARLYFPRLDFLLRSKVIAYIGIQGISWGANVDSSAIRDIESRNRNVYFISSQNLSEFKDKNLGQISYKMDFSPLIATILKYYLIIALCFYALLVLFQAIDIMKPSFLSQESLLPAIYQYYKRINPLYRHSFWILFIACNVVYFFHTAQFLWGKEDWEVTMFDGYIAVGGTVFMGRYTPTLQVWLHNNWILPVLNNIIAFVALSISGILVSVYLGLQRKLWLFVLVGLCFCVQPFILGRLYFTYQAAGLFIAAMMGILGFVLAKKAGEFSPAKAQPNSLSLSLSGKQNSTESAINSIQNSQSFANSSPNSTKNSQNSSKFKPYALCLLATICIHWGIASYQAFIDSALILLCAGGIALIVENRGDIKLAIFKSRFLVIATFLAALSYKIILDFLKKIDYVKETYNNSLTPLHEMPERIVLAFQYGFNLLFKPKMEYIAQSIGVVWGIVIAVAFVFLCKAKFSLFAKFAVILLFVLMIFASQTHIVLADTIVSNLYLHFYGLMFLYVGLVAVAFKLFQANFGADFANSREKSSTNSNVNFALSNSMNLMHNALVVAVCVFIWISALHCLYEQKIHKFTIDKDLAFINRLVERIENLEGFSYEKQYCGVMFGAPQNNFVEAFNSHVVPPWDIGPVLGRMMVKNVFDYGCGMRNDGYILRDPELAVYKKLLKRLYDAGVLDTLQPWPHKNSVVLFEDIIVFVASPENLIEQIKADFAKGEQ